MKKQSEFGKIKLVEALDALYYLIGTLGGSWLTYVSVFKHLPSEDILIGMASAAAIPAFLSIFKRAAKNSDGKLLRKEKSVMADDDVPRTGGGTVPPLP